MWTEFFDVHSGGDKKERYSHIAIEANREFAITYFKCRFKHDPERVTCDCCGEDYQIEEFETLNDVLSFWNQLKVPNSDALIVTKETFLIFSTNPVPRDK